MDNQKTYLSKEKYKELSNELDFLTTTRRKEIAEKLEYAKSLGDLSENAEYQEARDDQAATEKRIAELELLLKNVEVVKKHHSDEVEIGSALVVQRVGEKQKRDFQIVGSEEADMATGKISNVSPLGKALMGGKKGDTVSFESPAGEVKYKIVSIE
ncbi:transcription elongation factor GreA [Patescibacteria group bacterium]